MQKIYLKFDNEVAFVDAIANTDYVITDDKTFQIHTGLSKETGATLTDSNGNEYPEMIYIPGFHVDCYMEEDVPLPDALSSFVISTPANPVHKLR